MNEEDRMDVEKVMGETKLFKSACRANIRFNFVFLYERGASCG